MTIFISYAKDDLKKIRPVLSILRDNNFNFWIDEEGIEGASFWRKEIVEAIASSSVILFFATNASCNSDAVSKELALANEEKIPILPVLLESVTIPSDLRYQVAGLQYIDLTVDWERGVRNIIISLLRFTDNKIHGDAPENIIISNNKYNLPTKTITNIVLVIVFVISLFWLAHRFIIVNTSTTEKGNAISTKDGYSQSPRDNKTLNGNNKEKSTTISVNENTVLDKDFLNINNLTIYDNYISQESWEKAIDNISNMKNGKRKQAIIYALYLAKLHPPFRLGGGSIQSGFDSPRLLLDILAKVGVKIEIKPGERASTALMRVSKVVDKPIPGDFILYKGSVGAFGLFIVHTGVDDHSSYGVGTLETNFPGAVYDLAMNPKFQQLGYFRIDYPDEK